MSLYGSIKEVQNTTRKSYLNLEQRFRENKLITRLWSQMAQDISQQITSLHELPKSFWIRLKKDQDNLLETIKSEINPKNIENKADLSLSECIEDAISSEESIILKIYVPLIRNLRKNWTGQALDFYIMVKAHIVRIKRVAEAYSGDPGVIQHSALLFQTFEKEIQEPEVELPQLIKPARKKAGKAQAKKKEKAKPKPKPKRAAVSKPKPKPKPKRAAVSKPKPKPKPKRAAVSKPKPKPKLKRAAVSKAKPKKASKQSQSLMDRSKIRRSRSKSLVEKTDIRRRRARR